MKQGVRWVPLEVEVSLTKGIPNIEFLGLPDTLAKESIKRIKTAFENCQLPWPNSERITINLRPSHIKKSSQGLDFPIAVGLLKALNYFEEFPFEAGSYFYGELDLNGKVHQPEDLKSFVPTKKQMNLVTGRGDNANYCQTQQVDTLLEIFEPQLVPPQNALRLLQKPKLEEDILFSESMAELLMILAAGEHHALFAGPAGSGKTTLAKVVHSLLRAPKEEEFRSIRKMHLYFNDEIRWRPMAAPHHSIPKVSMVGGNAPIVPGELSRAHGGVLLLDELLEFSTTVQESLREPMEAGVVRISRKGLQATLPANFQTIATTNLCPCGKYVPGSYVNCRFSLRRCKGYLERLSGPLVDRFDVLFFSDRWQKQEKTIGLHELEEELKSVFEFQASQKTVNAKLEIRELTQLIDPEVQLLGYWGDDMSLRRKRAVLRVGKTLADLERSKTIQPHHLSKAAEYAIRPFVELESLN